MFSRKGAKQPGSPETPLEGEPESSGLWSHLGNSQTESWTPPLPSTAPRPPSPAVVSVEGGSPWCEETWRWPGNSLPTSSLPSPPTSAAAGCPGPAPHTAPQSSQRMRGFARDLGTRPGRRTEWEPPPSLVCGSRPGKLQGFSGAGPSPSPGLTRVKQNLKVHGVTLEGWTCSCNGWPIERTFRRKGKFGPNFSTILGPRICWWSLRNSARSCPVVAR